MKVKTQVKAGVGDVNFGGVQVAVIGQTGSATNNGQNGAVNVSIL